jgi:hypothetical protein
MHLLVRTGRFLWTLLPLCWTTALDLHMASSTRLSNIAVFQVGAETADQWTQAEVCAELQSFLDTLPCWAWEVSSADCHRRWNLGSLLWTRIQKTIHVMVTHILSCQEKFKSAPSAGKLVLTLFWDMSGPILKHYQQKGETVNSVTYSTVLEEKLKPAIRSSCHILLSKGILLLHNNMQPHTAAATVTTVQKLKFETVSHPLTVQTSLHPTIMCLACLRKH